MGTQDAVVQLLLIAIPVVLLSLVNYRERRKDK